MNVDPLVPNEETIEAIKAARRGETVTAGNPENLLKSLNEDKVVTVRFPVPGATDAIPRDGIELCTEDELEYGRAVFEAILTEGEVVVTMRPGRLWKNGDPDEESKNDRDPNPSRD